MDEGFTAKVHKASNHLSEYLQKYLKQNITKIRHREVMVDRGEQTNFNF